MSRSSRPTSLTVFGPTAGVSATVTGSAQGGTHSTARTSETIRSLTDHSLESDTLNTIREEIKRFNSKIEDPFELDSGLKTFRNENLLGPESHENIQGTRQVAAAPLGQGSEALGIVGLNGLQSLSDGIIASQVTAPKLKKSSDEKATQWQASTLPALEGEPADNFFACLKHFTKTIPGEMRDLNQKIDERFPDEKKNSFQSLHHTVVSSMTATSLAPSAIMGFVSSGLWDVVGSFLQSIQKIASDTRDFSKNEQGVYDALCDCVASLSKTQQTEETLRASLQNLNRLIDELIKVQPISNEQNKQVLTGTRPVTKLASLISAPVVSSLKLVVLSGLATVLSAQAFHQVNQEKGTSDRMQDSSAQAGSLEVVDDQGREVKIKSHSKNISELTHYFEAVNAALIGLIRAKPLIQQGSSDKDTALYEVSVSHLLTATFTLLPSLVLALSGYASRESEITSRFTSVSSKDISDQSFVVTEAEEKQRGNELDQLQQVACALEDALVLFRDFGVSSPVVTGFTRSVVSGSTVSAVNLVLGGLSAAMAFSEVVAKRVKATDSQLIKEEQDKVKNSMDDTGQSDSSLNFAPPSESLENTVQTILEKVILSNRISRSAPLIELNEIQGRGDLNSVGKSSIKASHHSSSGLQKSGEFITGTLFLPILVLFETGISASTLVLALYDTLKALVGSLSNIQTLSEGPDKTGSTNLSFLSNALRLLANSTEQSARELKENEDGCRETGLSVAGTIQSGVKTSEVVLSRWFTFALCQAGVIYRAWRNLTEQQKQPPSTTQVRGSTIASINPEVCGHLAQAILNELQAAQENKASIPGLNQDMANQIQSLGQTGIASLLASESTFIESFFTAHRNWMAGSENSEEHKKEAITGTSGTAHTLQFSNIIQNFTLACIAEAKKREPVQSTDSNHSDWSFQDSHGATENGNLLIAECSSHLCRALDVLIIGTGLSRSLTLIDQEKAILTSKETLDITGEESKLNTQLFTAQIKENSLRSSFTRVTETLKRCADQLAKELGERTDDDILKDGLHMHQSEVAFLRTLKSVITKTLSIISKSVAISSGISLIHVFSRDNADSVRKFIHSSADELRVRRGKSSGPSVKETQSEESKEITQSTATLVDTLVCDTTVNLIRMLLQSATLSADVLLSVSKLIEILSHEDPMRELRNEWQALCMSNVTDVTIGSSVASLVCTGQASESKEVTFIDSTLKSSFQSLQNKADEKIISIKKLDDIREEYKGDISEQKGAMGLKEYIHRVIKTLAPSLEDWQCAKLVKIFNHGGIGLTSYHSQPLGQGILPYAEGQQLNEPLIPVEAGQEPFRLPPVLKGIDGVKELLEEFIERMFSQYLAKMDQEGVTPLDTFVDAFIERELTPKAKEVHTYVVNRIASKVSEARNLSKRAFWNEGGPVFVVDKFTSKYIEGQEYKQQTPVEKAISDSQKARDIRAIRRQNRFRIRSDESIQGTGTPHTSSQDSLIIHT